MRHAQSVRYGLERFDSTTSAFSKAAVNIPFFQKLCWICEQLGYAYEFADIIGARLLGLEEASGTITAIDGVVPTLDDMVEFLTLAFERFTSFSDLSLVILDDFQWIDPLSWKVIRSLKDARRNLIVVCAARSHDKQAMRRMSSEKIKGDELRLLTIDLGPLDTTEMREMIAMGLGYEESAINSTFANDIYEQTGGLPVYAVEYVESIKRSNLTEMDSKGIVGWRESASGQRVSCCLFLSL
jgi:predicted ATPase